MGPLLVVVLATSPSTADWQRQQLTTNRVMLGVLGGWAAANIIGGAIGAASSADPQTRFFSLGNAAWNIVNLGLAAIGLLSDILAPPKPFDARTSLESAHGQEKVLLLNIGLDVAYLATAAFLWQRGEATGDPRLVGVGHALLLQGGFLLVFDSVYAVLAGRLTKSLEPLISMTAQGAPLAGLRGAF